jgi:hypothetical protein
MPDLIEFMSDFVWSWWFLGGVALFVAVVMTLVAVVNHCDRGDR